MTTTVRHSAPHHFTPDEAERFLATWYRIVAGDGSTVGYAPDLPTANAFAAASELIAALRDAVSVLGKVVADMPDIALPGFPEEALKRAEAAIRRATDGAA